MNRIVRDTIMLMAASTAGYCAYKWMSPGAKREIGRDMKRTMTDIGDVREDMAHMASTLKDTF